MKKHIQLITPETLIAYRKSFEESKSIEKKIVDRIDYIVQILCKVFDRKLRYWCFPDAQEGEIGTAYHYIYDFSISIEFGFSYKRNDYMDFIDKNGEVCTIINLLPVRWLFEDFEKELTDGVKKYKDSLTIDSCVKKAKAQESKNKRLIASAKSKLTKEELEALLRSR